ncbi:MAG: glycosyltransferase, partial [Pseudomonadales bacterium]|nr:glycosyltransferase [Pseudomonadales bacterium]
SDWLDQLYPIAQRSDVGAVGCLLLYPDKTVQHGGIALDQQSLAKHIALNEPQNFYARAGFGQPIAVHAVTAACLLTRRKTFEQVGGFNTEELAVAYNDVDYCLRLAESGLPSLFHPGVCLIHHESISRQADDLPDNRARAQREFDYMQQRWEQLVKENNYTSGIPDFMTAQKMTQSDLSATIRNSGKLFEHESKATIDSSHEKANYPTPVVASTGTSAGADQLREENRELRQHIERMEEAHRLIEQSIFWRITAPLRLLRDLILGRRKAEPANITKREDAQPGLATGTSVNEVSSAPPPSTKEEHDAHAKQKLSEFLSSDARLTFTAANEVDISIVLVFYNQAHLSLLCLQSIIEHADTSYEVIIVDNQSSDETPRLLEKIDNAKIIGNDSNVGFVQAVNQAAAAATGEHLLMLNNDALLEATTLSTALTTLQSASDIGAVGAKIKLRDGTMQEAGSIIWSDGACAGYGRGEDPLAYQFMMRRDVDYCSGAFLLMETALFRKLGCFDEDFAPAYYEESDFCIRLHEAGYRVVYEPNAQITHYEFASTGGIAGASQLQQEHRNILCTKHPDYLRSRPGNDPANLLKARTANNHPNILIIDDRVPFPSLGAGYPRCSHILNTLATAPVNLTFYPLLFPTDDWQQVYGLLSPNIEVAMGLGRSGLLDFLRERQGFFQTIMVSRVHNMTIFNHIMADHPELLDDVQVIYDAEAVSAPREILRRRLWGEQISKEEEHAEIAEELKQASEAQKVVAVSDQEAELYHQHGIAQTTVLGHRLDLNATEKTFSERNGMLFVGALRDEGSPNVDSLLWFLINCLPLIEADDSQLTLYVVGDNTVPSLATVAKDNVVFTGRLESIDEYYNSCRLFIAPTRFAAGIPHKVHEAASMGLPSVTTSLLAKQLNWTDEKQLLCADTAADFAKQCLRLHSNEVLWNGIRQAGLSAIEEDCSPAAFRSSLMQLFDLAVD